MKKLDVSPISNSSQFFPKKGTLLFLQLAYQEGLSAIIQSMIGPAYDPTAIYIIEGCRNTGTYPAYSITAGFIYYAGEIFYVDATTFTATGSNVAVVSIVQTQYTTDADPCTFSDATTHNIHNIRKMVIAQGVAGSTLVDYSACSVISLVIPSPLNLTATGISSVSGAYPNLNIDTPAPTPQITLLWLGNISGDGATVTKLSGTKTVSSVNHTGTGAYTINHNIGNTNYWVSGIGIDAVANLSAPKTVLSVASSSVVVHCSDDSSPNDCQFQLAIYGY